MFYQCSWIDIVQEKKKLIVFYLGNANYLLLKVYNNIVKIINIKYFFTFNLYLFVLFAERKESLTFLKYSIHSSKKF